MIFKAIEFSSRAHHGQYRKGTKIPYIVHPLGVAKILIDYGYPEHLAVAGILHDTVEDTPVTLADIEQIFGKGIAALVESASEPDKSDTWENRKKHTVESIKTIPNEAVALCLADKLDNIRAIREDLERNGEKVWHRFIRPREKQKWYYKGLATSFTERLPDEKSRSLFDLFRTEVDRVFQDGMTRTASFPVTKIVSGGQTGADRAALDIAIRHNIPHGGWVPKGRKTEDGPLPEQYHLQEMPSGEYSKRTEQNILDSDGTLIVSHGRLTGGSTLTEFLADKHEKPCIHIDLNKSAPNDAFIMVRKWIDSHNIKVLNVAGPRASIDPRIYDATLAFLEKIFYQVDI
jgi:hypothetical protein